jgi:hypothetical protein
MLYWEYIINTLRLHVLQQFCIFFNVACHCFQNEYIVGLSTWHPNVEETGPCFFQCVQEFSFRTGPDKLYHAESRLYYRPQGFPVMTTNLLGWSVGRLWCTVEATSRLILLSINYRPNLVPLSYSAYAYALFAYLAWLQIESIYSNFPAFLHGWTISLILTINSS